MWAIERSPYHLVNSNDLLRPHTPSWNESNCDQCENKIQKWQLWKTHDNKTYIVQKIEKNMRNLLTIFFVLTPLPEMKKMWSMRKRNYKNDNFDNKKWIVQKIVQNMRNLLWCCRATVARKDSQQTPGDREPGEVLKSCNLEQSSSSFSSCALSSNMTSPLTR